MILEILVNKNQEGYRINYLLLFNMYIDIELIVDMFCTKIVL